MSLESLLSGYGPAAVFAGCLLEGETVALLGGLIAHRTGATGLAGPVGMATMAGMGVFVADQFWFLMGRHAPDRGHIAHVRMKARSSRLAGVLGRHPLLSILGYRFIPGASRPRCSCPRPRSAGRYSR